MLIDHAVIEGLVVHRVGNQSRGEGLQLSTRLPAVNAGVSSLLLAGYLKGIVSDKKKFQFFHETDLKLNEIYLYSRQYFAGELDLLTVSQRIARHLYAHSLHPNISAGDLFIIAFSGLLAGEESIRGLGIFKAEIHDDLITINETVDTIDIGYINGINPRLIDKGALILEQGPTVYAVDRLGQQSKFWFEDFLHAMRVPDAASNSRMLIQAVQKVSAEIPDPLLQADFKQACQSLCEQTESISAGQLKSLAERYMPPAQVGEVFEQAAARFDLARDDALSSPALNMSRHFQKSLSRYGVGHGISLLLPAGFSLKNIHSADNHVGELTLTLMLKKNAASE